MTALAAERDTRKKQTTEVLDGLIKGNVKIYGGSLVVRDAGYVAPGRTATGLVALGRAKATVDNTGGSAGAYPVEVEPGIFKWANGDSIVQADVGAPAYIVDDQTVSKASSGKSLAGTIMGVDSDGVWVWTTGQDHT